MRIFIRLLNIGIAVRIAPVSTLLITTAKAEIKGDKASNISARAVNITSTNGAETSTSSSIIGDNCSNNLAITGNNFATWSNTPEANGSINNFNFCCNIPNFSAASAVSHIAPMIVSSLAFRDFVKSSIAIVPLRIADAIVEPALAPNTSFASAAASAAVFAFLIFS